jgi:hypothetical protein
VTNQTPPRAPLAFRVGIVGHRPNRLTKADLAILGATISKILSETKAAVTTFHREHPDLYATKPILRAITPLAEGTDRLFAQAAIDLKYAICCPMPFPRAEYERDMVPPCSLEQDSTARFAALLKDAESYSDLVVFELDGDRAEAGEAYGSAGRVVLNQSDLLVVVWDGEKPAGRGGTVDTLREAIRYRVPVVWIDAIAPHDWCVLGEDPDLHCLEGKARCVPPSGGSTGLVDLRKVIQATLELPEDETGSQKIYFGECQPHFNPAVAWKTFRSHVGEGRVRVQNPHVLDFEKAVEHDWSTGGGGVASWVNERLRPHYAWSDKLADIYADHHRSAIVLAYPLAALSVLFALVSGLFHRGLIEGIFVGLELVAIVWIVYLISWGRRRHWHDRWLDYRLLAEFIRQARILIPLGGGRPFPRLPLHLETYGSPSRTWMSWHTRAIARAVGLPSVKVNGAYVRECLAYLKAVVDGQRDFHVNNMNRSKKIEHRLHHWAEVLLVITVAAMVFHLGHLVVVGVAAESQLTSFVTLLCAFFPALGAAFAGMNNQGEFARLEKRSRAMAEKLDRVSKELEKLAGANRDIKLKEITPYALDVAQLMVDEVLDWRVVFIDRPPVMPV